MESCHSLHALVNSKLPTPVFTPLHHYELFNLDGKARLLTLNLTSSERPMAITSLNSQTLLVVELGFGLVRAIENPIMDSIESMSYCRQVVSTESSRLLP